MVDTSRAQQNLRERKPQPGSAAAPAAQGKEVLYNGARADASKYRARAIPTSRWWDDKDWAVMAVVTLLGASLRFWQLSNPTEVVFDEVHFGKFAAYYIRREYFFDVHPPLAKLLHALGAWLAGFDGVFEFENIGDKYLKYGVPYVRMRSTSAILGTLQVPLLYGIMRETGVNAAVSAFTTALLIFDNGHITQYRLILLDAPLTLFMMWSFYAYLRFYKQRYNEFSLGWWTWLLATGAGLALTIACKMVGLFTIVTIGAAVLVDLWRLLDVKRGQSMQHFGKHFAARTVGLIVWPACIYLFTFWIHFAVLNKSGTGDSFMTAEFQHTLHGNPNLQLSKRVHYYDRVMFKHKGTDAFLHSHAEHYPLKYDDGRISSQGQQVTGYPHNDTNNWFQLIPTKAIPESPAHERALRNGDVIRLLHVNTESYLMSHDVASPLTATNTEFTTIPANDTESYDNTLFEIKIDGVGEGHPKAVASKADLFHVIHKSLRVSMFASEATLPEWGYKQQEINGNKNALDKRALWTVDEIAVSPDDPDYEERVKPNPPREVKSMNFFKKFVELQLQMLHQNNLLTSSHPYATGPINWPFVLSGISFWTDDENKRQIYMVGNLVSWWIGVLSVSIYSGIMVADALARRRGTEPIEPNILRRMHNTTGFFVMAWLFHYAPFYLMSRQLFIHHYLPAHICSIIVGGLVINFVASETIEGPLSEPGPLLLSSAPAPSAVAGGTTPDSAAAAAANEAKALGLYPHGPKSRPEPMTRNELTLGARLLMFVLLLALIAVFWWTSPLTYGMPSLTPEQVKRRKLMPGWTLHFA
ncbi:Dolichyl-phosphate-mannose--protein mannosyltransferase 4 [Tilletia horrida]|uniref:Dolichyl-phosphate-mannose--protein mannosyltransferase n=1 Tax=Tilletia horrida TaxID=155126 RepID=A0AAN6G7M7_9BASI|nr:Dolichyl-phosphate-mannose--protein mannosyltransferase 4 [Tilletia horrida]KAK0525183.1 Dolichyl-phosphate-mannose--protein mannosyltransferase 4 [Tilletia horrida]KAK0528595.1 Dolichyl-phosphate-mannose--protein mannosyltransferase 4 [Tilletia horrida]